MNYDNIRNCKTLQEAVLEIINQNLIIKTEQFVNKQTANNAQGLYLITNSEIENTIFDVWVYICELQYCKLLEDDTEDTKRASTMLCLEVLKNWIEGKYKIEYPSTIEELIKIMQNKTKAEFTTKYLRGVCNRLANNSLYYKSRGNNNTISSKKYYIHEKGHKKTVNKYIYLDYFYLDVRYNDGFDGLSTGYDILDIEAYKNQKMKSTEDVVFNEDVDLDTLFNYLVQKKIITAKNLKKIERKLEEDNISLNLCTMLFNRMINEINYERLEAIKVKRNKSGNKKVVYFGDFIALGRDLMKLHTLEDKFYLIKKILQNKSKSAKIIHDLIIDLGTDIHVELYTNIQDDRFIKYYVKSENFRIILDTILDEYIAQQKRIKNIYVYNETQRREKLRQIEEAIEDKKDKDNRISKEDFAEVFQMTDNLFRLQDNCDKKNYFRKLDNQLEVMKVLGFDIKRDKNRNSKILLVA